MTATQPPARATQSRDRRALIQARLSQLSSSSITAQKQHQLLQGSKVADLIQTALMKKVLSSQEQSTSSTNVGPGTSKPSSLPPVAVSLVQPSQQPVKPPVMATTALPTAQPPLTALQVSATAELRTSTPPVAISVAADQPQLSSLGQTQPRLATPTPRPAGTNLTPQQLLAQQQQLVSQQQAIFNRLQQAQRVTVGGQAQATAPLPPPQPGSSLTAQQQRQLLAIQQSQVASQQLLQQRGQTQAQPGQIQAHSNQPQVPQPVQQVQQQPQEASGSRLKISVRATPSSWCTIDVLLCLVYSVLIWQLPKTFSVKLLT